VTANRRLIRSVHAINDPAFVAEAVAAYREINARPRARRQARVR
jgi:uncharacterized protein (UPF0261 family)